MTALTLGFLIALHGFAAQMTFSGGTFQGVSQGEAVATITFDTTEGRGAALRGYGGSMFVRSAPFGLENSEVINTAATLIEPYGDVPGANGELVEPRTDSIPEDDDQTCPFC